MTSFLSQLLLIAPWSRVICQLIHFSLVFTPLRGETLIHGLILELTQSCYIIRRFQSLKPLFLLLLWEWLFLIVSEKRQITLVLLLRWTKLKIWLVDFISHHYLGWGSSSCSKVKVFLHLIYAYIKQLFFFQLSLCWPKVLRDYINPKLPSHKEIQTINKWIDLSWQVLRIAVLWEEDILVDSIEESECTDSNHQVKYAHHTVCLLLSHFANFRDHRSLTIKGIFL